MEINAVVNTLTVNQCSIYNKLEKLLGWHKYVQVFMLYAMFDFSATCDCFIPTLKVSVVQGTCIVLCHFTCIRVGMTNVPGSRQPVRQVKIDR